MEQNDHSETIEIYQDEKINNKQHQICQSLCQLSEDQWFVEQRASSRSILATWGLPLGELTYNTDNMQTLRCLVELISFRETDLQFRNSAKEEIAALKFQRDKYCRYLEQAQKALEECVRRQAPAESDLSGLRSKNSRREMQVRKQKDEDKKVIAMLKAKNEQILLQIKKKQQQIYRLKQQLKKLIGDKSANQGRTSFEVFEVVTPSKQESINKQQILHGLQIQQKQRVIGELSTQNNVLRDCLKQLRQKLLDFNSWIDCDLFGKDQSDERQTRFPLDHNMLFKKNGVVNQFADILEIASNGVTKLRFVCWQAVEKNVKTPEKQDKQKEENNFQKKSPRIETMPIERTRPGSKDGKIRQIRLRKKSDQNLLTDRLSPRSKRTLPIPKCEPPRVPRQKNAKLLSPRSNSLTVQKQKVEIGDCELPFEGDLMSDILERQESSISIVSHIEIDKVGQSLWETMYQETNDQE